MPLYRHPAPLTETYEEDEHSDKSSNSEGEEEDESSQTESEESDDYEEPVDYENKLKVYKPNVNRETSNSFLVSLILKEIGPENAHGYTLKEIEKIVKEKIEYYIMLINDCGNDEKLKIIYKNFNKIQDAESSTASDQAILREAIKRAWFSFQDQVQDQVGEWTYTYKYTTMSGEDSEI